MPNSNPHGMRLTRGIPKVVQIVESYREVGRVRQPVLLTLGRLDRLMESGELDRLLAVPSI